jgi:hypothetical protein
VWYTSHGGWCWGVVGLITGMPKAYVLGMDFAGGIGDIHPTSGFCVLLGE